MREETLGQLIRRRRKELGLKQWELADMIGISGAYMSHIENGIQRWPQNHIRRISRVLMIPESSLAAAAGMIAIPREDKTGVRSLNLALEAGGRIVCGLDPAVGTESLLTEMSVRFLAANDEEKARRYAGMLTALLGFIALTTDLSDDNVRSLALDLDITRTNDELDAILRPR